MIARQASLEKRGASGPQAVVDLRKVLVQGSISAHLDNGAKRLVHHLEQLPLEAQQMVVGHKNDLRENQRLRKNSSQSFLPRNSFASTHLFAIIEDVLDVFAAQVDVRFSEDALD